MPNGATSELNHLKNGETHRVQNVHHNGRNRIKYGHPIYTDTHTHNTQAFLHIYYHTVLWTHMPCTVGSVG